MKHILKRSEVANVFVQFSNIQIALRPGSIVQLASSDEKPGIFKVIEVTFDDDTNTYEYTFEFQRKHNCFNSNVVTLTRSACSKYHCLQIQKLS